MSAVYNLSDALLGLGGSQMRKRGNQSGSMRMRSGRWYGRYFKYVKDDHGNLVYKEVEEKLDATAEKPARRELWVKVQKADMESAVPEGNATLSHFIESRFKPDHIDKLTEGGRRHYGTMLNHIEPSLGKIRLKDIGALLVQRLLTSKSESGLSAQTVRHIRNALSAILRYARDLEFIQGRLATEPARIPKGESKKAIALSVEQANLLLSKIPAKYKPLVHFFLVTGARASEAAGLRWADVNLTEHATIVDGEARKPYTVHFRNGYRYGRYQGLKTKNSRRDVPLTAALWVEMQTLFEQSAHTQPGDPVFTACRNEATPRPTDMHNFLARVYKPIVVKLGMPDVNLHSLRHTMSTWLDAAGAPMGQRIRLLGHAGAAMTMEYTQSDVEAARLVMEKTRMVQ